MQARIVYSESDPAALNMVEHIEKLGTRRFSIEPFSGSQLNFSPKSNGDIYVCLSTHKSEKRVRSLTSHHTGNWTSEAKYGGNPNDVCIAAPSFITGIARTISEKVKSVPEYVFSLEVTHHGPTGNFPLVFVEIGSCAEDWGNKAAGNAIAESIAEFEPASEGEVVMGVGGPHYAPNFTKQISKYRIGHIIPKYAVDGLEYGTFVMGIERSLDKVEKVLIDWKGLDGPQREKILKFCTEYGIESVKYK